ncbi:hypothetical protein FGO68_gene10470 [Halteria grandinella]|uniref:Uncharacterized protein n=1 Tax=Halteria grandinella TaxID=5974 RepID=A0A8J8P3Q3_HALGN|nr:hypothetical protein FGO68_gene10470 [Halteria grandinella]
MGNKGGQLLNNQENSQFEQLEVAGESRKLATMKSYDTVSHQDSVARRKQTNLHSMPKFTQEEEGSADGRESLLEQSEFIIDQSVMVKGERLGNATLSFASDPPTENQTIAKNCSFLKQEEVKRQPPQPLQILNSALDALQLKSPTKQDNSTQRESLLIPSASKRRAPEYLDLISMTSNRRESFADIEREELRGLSREESDRKKSGTPRKKHKGQVVNHTRQALMKIQKLHFDFTQPIYKVENEMRANSQLNTTDILMVKLKLKNDQKVRDRAEEKKELMELVQKRREETKEAKRIIHLKKEAQKKRERRMEIIDQASNKRKGNLYYPVDEAPSVTNAKRLADQSFKLHQNKPKASPSKDQLLSPGQFKFDKKSISMLSQVKD